VVEVGKLFEQTEINGLILENRFVRSATSEGMADDKGAVTQKLIETMIALAKGKVGLIITGHTFVLTEGQASPRQMGIYDDALIDGLRELTAVVHNEGGKILVQLSHAGKFAAKQLTGQEPWVVSKDEESVSHQITKDDIRKIITAFANAAQRAKASGFDGIQIHSAHGYLLSQFLSPVFNRRKDEYGGDIQNRCRIHIEILSAIREVVGKDYPILLKLNCRDFVENGLSLEDSVKVGRMLADAGLDAIELSGGLLTSGKLSPSRSGIKSEEDEAYFRNEAKFFKDNIDIPLILVGGVRSFRVAEFLVTGGIADYISMSRPFIREPDLIRRWQSGDLGKSGCISDNRCFKALRSRNGNGIYCVAKDKEI
jgi:2,4-dienoyl-CoA reductase-like NADH-dependent reductase (Old Yellow Enzyme family)